MESSQHTQKADYCLTLAYVASYKREAKGWASLINNPTKYVTAALDYFVSTTVWPTIYKCKSISRR